MKPRATAMSEANTDFPMGSAISRVKLNLYRCVVCGELRAGATGYVFYQSGRTRLGAPFCKTHLDQSHQYAKPVFENQPALDLFKQMFPQTYREDVEGKPILFFNTYRLKKANEYLRKIRKLR